MLSSEVFIALVIFSAVASGTPGPNNMMILASSMNFGWRRTMSPLLGVVIGFGILLLAIGLGIGQLLDRYPALLVVLKAGGGLYLLYLAYRIATAPPSDGIEHNKGLPISFFGAAAFQWFNPKAWLMAIAAMATYTNPDSYLPSMLVVTLSFVFVGVLSLALWAGLGSGMGRLLRNPSQRRIFNYIMAALLMMSLGPLLL